MFDRGLHLTLQAMRRQLTGMPSDLYLIRLIHHPTRRAFPGERLWTATELLHPATVRFLRVRNQSFWGVALDSQNAAPLCAKCGSPAIVTGGARRIPTWLLSRRLRQALDGPDLARWVPLT